MQLVGQLLRHFLAVDHTGQHSQLAREVIPIQDVGRRGEQRHLHLAQLTVAVGEHHRGAPLGATRCDNMVDPRAGQYVDAAHESDTSLGLILGHYPAGDDFETVGTSRRRVPDIAVNLDNNVYTLA